MADPTAVPGLVGRWVADDLTAGWTNWTGRVNGYTFTSASLPTLTPNTLNGHAVLDFNGSTNTLTCADFPQSPTLVLAAVIRTKTLKTSYQYPVAFGSFKTTFFGNSGAGYRLAENGGNSGWSLVSDTAWHLVTAQSFNRHLWIDGVDKVGASADTTLTYSAGDQLTIANGAIWPGQIAELLAYTQTPDAAGYATIDTYIQNTYGITTSDYVPSASAGGWVVGGIVF